LAVEPWWPAKGCHWHCGVDVGMPIGTRLLAARAGQAHLVSYGLLTISVSPTEADCYVHIDLAVVSVGTWVKRGQLIAYSGAKVPAGGSLTGPHLHFEVQTGPLNNPATSLDPIPVLEGAEMTPEQAAQLKALYDFLENGPPPAGAWHDAFAKLVTKADLAAAVKTIPQAQGGGLTDGQAGQLSGILQLLTRVFK
jgi:hypothetical protein